MKISNAQIHTSKCKNAQFSMLFQPSTVLLLVFFLIKPHSIRFLRAPIKTILIKYRKAYGFLISYTTASTEQTQRICTPTTEKASNSIEHIRGKNVQQTVSALFEMMMHSVHSRSNHAHQKTAASKYAFSKMSNTHRIINAAFIDMLQYSNTASKPERECDGEE